MSRFKLLYFVIFIINLYKINAQISDKRLCVDDECKVPISYARTLLRYSSPDSKILSFAPNADVIIYSKSAGSRLDLWGGEINGKRGYIPKHLVRETKVLEKPTRLVDTEFANKTETNQVPSQVQADKVQEPYEVVDGTTIYLNPQDAISPTSTESPIQPTALPVTNTGQNNNNDDKKAPEVVSSEPKSKGSEVDSGTPKKEEISSKDQILETNPNDSKEIQPEGDVKVESVVDNVLSKLSDWINEENKQEEEETGEEDDGDEDNEGDDDEDDENDEDNDDEEKEDTNDDGKEKPKTEPLLNDQVNHEIKSEEIVSTMATPIDVNKEDPSVNSQENTENKSEVAPVVTDINKEIGSKIMPRTETENVAPINPEEIPSSDVDSSAETIDSNPKLKSEIDDANPVSENSESEETIKTQESKEEIIKENQIHSNEADEISISTEEVIPQQISEETQNIDVTNEVKDETTTAPNIEITTVAQEMEVPQPFIEEVTPNPLETVSEETKIENVISTLPPLGLFDNQIVNNNNNIDNLQSPSEEHVPVDFSKVEEFASSEQKNEDFSFNEVEVKPNEDLNIDTTVNKSGEENESAGFFSSFFGGSSEGEEKTEDKPLTSDHSDLKDHREGDDLISKYNEEQFCDAASCDKVELTSGSGDVMDLFNFNSNIFICLVTTAISVIIFLFGYIAFDKSKREGPLVAKINKLEKELLIILKENEILQEKISDESGYDTNDRVPNEVVENLKEELTQMKIMKNSLEDQIQSLEKELENSTEVGMELNRMLSEILSSERGSDVLKANVEHLQRQLVEQQSTINSINETLAMTNTENHELKLELDLSNKKVVDLQAELDKLFSNILKIEEEKEIQQNILESEIAVYKQKFEEINNKLKIKEEEHNNEMKQIRNRLDQTERNLEMKIKEHDILTDTLKQLKVVKNNGELTLQSLLDVSEIKAELQLLKSENLRLEEKLQQEQEAKLVHQKRASAAMEETQQLKEQYDEADKMKVEAQTKLEVLSNYFKDREAELQKEISKHESLWVEKQGEATSTTERIKFMQEQLQNYKAQTESLKQEIVSQEVELKSQISVLEKKVHENWVSARQAERKLEDAKQEAAQLRHRLTLRERAMQDDKTRLQSPIEQNGDLPIESPASPPLLYGARDHITKSPPIPGLPPFLPPPPGVPFMPPPLHGVPPFIPPPPTMFPGDHRPPPLGRMSSPPLNSRYSPSSRGYSPYDRNSSSPSDSEYGTSPPHRRGYSPFNSRDDRRDYKRPSGRSNGRNVIKGGASSGSGNSNESLEKINRQQSKV